MLEKMVIIHAAPLPDTRGEQEGLCFAWVSVQRGDRVYHFTVNKDEAADNVVYCDSDEVLMTNVWHTLLEDYDPADPVTFTGWKIASYLWPALVFGAIRYSIPIPPQYKAPLDRYYAGVLPLIDVFNVYRQGRTLTAESGADMSVEEFLYYMRYDVKPLIQDKSSANSRLAIMQAMRDIVAKYNTPYLTGPFGEPVPSATGWVPLDA